MSIISSDPLRVGLFGASPDTGNMGVSALHNSFLYAMGRRLPGLTAVVFDNELDKRVDSIEIDDRRMPVVRFGARGGRRYHRMENLRTMATLSRFRIGARLNQGLALIDGCQAVMDVSGGDSFSDIYGAERFRNIVLPKQIAARRSRPLLLLPQTYGPFREPRHRTVARDAILGAQQVWSRDLRSHEILKELVGDYYDPHVHRTGVDMAFGLTPEAPPQPIQEQVADWLESGAPRVGINVSGLIWDRGNANLDEFGFKADYRSLLRQLIEWLLSTSDANVLLISHVYSPDGLTVTDSAAAAQLIASLTPQGESARRIRIAPDIPDERQLKWLIAKADWFCGTRMHATIAGLSSGVPTASITYSDKALGVFETCGQGGQIVDPRQGTTEECFSHLQTLFRQRHEARHALTQAVAALKLRLDSQMDEIARFATGQT